MDFPLFFHYINVIQWLSFKYYHTLSHKTLVLGLIELKDQKFLITVLSVGHDIYITHHCDISDFQIYCGSILKY